MGSVLRKRRPIQLTFFLTRKCNARCPFCFYLSRPKAAQPAPELSLHEIEKVSSSLGTLLWLAFSGGEPFLRDDLPEIAGLFYKNNKPAIILLPTNGLLPGRIYDMTERVLKQCPNSTVVVKLSLDGPETVHDSLRGVPGAFQNVLKTRELLAPLLERHPNFELGINSVFCSDSQQQMHELIGFVKGLKGIRTHTVSLIRGDTADDKLKAVDRQTYADTIRLLESNLKDASSSVYGFTGARLKAAQDILQRRLINDTVWEKRRMIPCYAGKLTLVLTEAGELFPCESFNLKMGNVRSFGCDVKKLLDSNEARKALHAVQDSGCYCTHECSMMMNILFNPALYPALIAEYFRLFQPAIRKSTTPMDLI